MAKLLTGLDMVQLAFLAALAVALCPISSVHAQPAGLSMGCQGAWQRYQAAQGRPKAFAADSRSCGWWQRNASASTLDDVREKAVNQCRTSGGSEACKLVDVQR